jgi:hypothetical protein
MRDRNLLAGNPRRGARCGGVVYRPPLTTPAPTPTQMRDSSRWRMNLPATFPQNLTATKDDVKLAAPMASQIDRGQAAGEVARPDQPASMSKSPGIPATFDALGLGGVKSMGLRAAGRLASLTCERAGCGEPATEVDHIQPQAELPELRYNMANLRSLWARGRRGAREEPGRQSQRSVCR